MLRSRVLKPVTHFEANLPSEERQGPVSAVVQHGPTATPQPCDAKGILTFLSRQVLAPSLKMLNGLEILLQYGNLTVNVSFQEVLRCALATQVSAEHVFDTQYGMFFAVRSLKSVLMSSNVRFETVPTAAQSPMPGRVVHLAFDKTTCFCASVGLVCLHNQRGGSQSPVPLLRGL